MCNAGDLGLIPGSGRSPGEGKGYPLVFWPGKFHALYSPWGCKESDTTDRVSLALSKNRQGTLWEADPGDTAARR